MQNIYTPFTLEWRRDLINNPPNAAKYFSKEEWEHIVMHELCKVDIHGRGMRGKTHNSATRVKMSKASKGRPKSESHKLAMRKPKSDSHKQKLRELNLGKIQSVETREKRSLSMSALIWWNNGVKSVRRTTCPGPEWFRGRIYL